MTAKNYYGIKIFFDGGFQLLQSYTLIQPRKINNKKYIAIWFRTEKERNDYLIKNKINA